MAQRRPERDDEDPIQRYLSEIGRYRLLTKDDEVRLARAIEAGSDARAILDSGAPLGAARRRELRRTARAGQDATELFVQSNLRLVVSIAKRYQSSGVPLLDLVQEGNLGLMHAVEKFDWRKGFKFSTYATWWIRQSVTRGIANTGRTIRIPVHASDTMARVQRTQTQMELVAGRRPSVSELAVEVGLPAEKVRECLRHAVEPLSLSEPLGEDSDSTLGDLIADDSGEGPEQSVVAEMLPELLASMMAALEERERDVLRFRYGLDRGEPRTLEEVGARFELTRERIRQIEMQAIAKLRHPSTDCDAADLLAV